MTSYFTRYDPKRVVEIDALLKRNEGKEAKLMLMLAIKYDTTNPLTSIYLKYHSRLSNEQLDDYAVLATLFLSVFRPSDLDEADTLLEKNKGKEDELFSKLVSSSFSCCVVLMSFSAAHEFCFALLLPRQPIFVQSIH